MPAFLVQSSTVISHMAVTSPARFIAIHRKVFGPVMFVVLVCARWIGVSPPAEHREMGGYMYAGA